MIPRKSAIVAQHLDQAVTEDQGGWSVVRSFQEREDFQIGLTDLSHRPKALIQGPHLDQSGMPSPGRAVWTGQAWVGRINPDEAVLFDLAGAMEPKWEDVNYTDTTDGWALMGIFGPKAREVAARLVEVDVERPEVDGPLYITTKAHSVHIHMINPKGGSWGFLVACNRSCGQFLHDACLHAGQHLGIRPAGLDSFLQWHNSVSG